MDTAIYSSRIFASSRKSPLYTLSEFGWTSQLRQQTITFVFFFAFPSQIALVFGVSLLPKEFKYISLSTAYDIGKHNINSVV